MRTTGCLLLGTLALACAMPPQGGGAELRELSRRAIRESEFPMNFCHAHNFPDGTIYLGHSIGCHMRGERGTAMFSSDFGRTWATNCPAIGGMNAFLTKDGRKRWVFAWDGTKKTVHAAEMTTIGKDGVRKTAKAKITCPKPMGMCTYRDVVRLRDGGLLLMAYARDEAVPSLRRGFPCGNTACLLRSDDDGENWRVLSFLPRCEGTQEGQCEGSVVELSDGRLMTFLRTGNGLYPQEKGTYALRSYVSTDGGYTWDGGRNVADYGVEPQAGLLSDGTLFVLSGRPGVYLLLDPTGTGDHFEKHEVFGGMGSSSSTLMELEPGRISIVYDDSQYSMWNGDHPTNRIMLVEYAYSKADGAVRAPQTWERPKTTRRYLQGPLAERLLVYWREGKVTVTEVAHEHDWRKTRYYNPDSTPAAHGVWLLHGEKDRPFDFREARLTVEPDATPIHAQVWREGDLEVRLEACAPFGRAPSAHLRLTLSNGGCRTVTHPFAFLLRSGTERGLIFSGPDLYDVYRPSIQPWLAMTNTWREAGSSVWKDGRRFVALRSGFAPSWDPVRGAVRLTATVPPGAVKTVDLTTGLGAVETPDYPAVRDRTRADWQRELARVQDRTDFLRFMTVQMLQCFSTPVGRGYALPRQGGQQQWVWPGEMIATVPALARLGYGEYAEAALDFYFGQYSNPDGEIGPFGNRWACDTACVLAQFARYCTETDNLGTWRKHREQAGRAFGWIRAKRRASKGMEGCIDGLFPPMRATDEQAVFQAWGNTDLTNLEAMERYAAALEHFGDGAAASVRAEADDYRRLIARLVDRWRQASAGRDTLFLPLDPAGRIDARLRKDGYFYCHPGRFAELGFLSGEEMVRVRNWLLREGYADARGLYFKHRSLPTDSHGTLATGHNVWYTTVCEQEWFDAWRRVGRDDLARQALESAIRYGTTEEFYVGERYNDATPWYLPWSPNSSGAGRIVQMLLADEVTKGK